MKGGRKIRGGKADHAVQRWKLRLYIADNTPKSVAALRNLKEMCEEHLPGRHEIEVVSLLKHPELARGDQILAVPAVVRKFPEPIRKIVGSLSDAERVLLGLDLTTSAPGAGPGIAVKYV